MAGGSIFIIPLHVRPVVSYDKLKRKNSLKRARSGLDRLNLTDVGQTIFSTWKKGGGYIKMGKCDLPFPWSGVLSRMNVEYARITGIMVQGTTYRSIFRIDITKSSPLLKGSVMDLDRDLLDSPYWRDDTWNKFYRMTGITRAGAENMNQDTMKGIPDP